MEASEQIIGEEENGGEMIASENSILGGFNGTYSLQLSLFFAWIYYQCQLSFRV